MLIVAMMIASTLSMSPVPDGRCILLNGSLGPGEWADSGTLRLDQETELRFHKDDASLFLAIVFSGPRHTGIDLYVESNGHTRMLHVSSALGDKVLEGNQWSEVAWGRNSWWSANVIGSIFEEGRQRFLEPDAFEFHIDRRELGESIRLFIHLKRPEKLLPAGASATASEEWVTLELE